mgnify:CR=1 FL=1
MNNTDLFVIDTTTGKIHRVGDDKHDALYVINDEVHYFNLHNGDGGGITIGNYRILKSDAGSLVEEYGILDKRYEKEIHKYLRGEV